MPDVIMMVPELEVVKKTSRKPICKWTNVVERETSRSCTPKPSNLCFCFKKLLGASPEVEMD
jgi:hypothetical protein